MTDDSTTTSTAERHVPVATIALGQHMLDHGLPRYSDVRYDSRTEPCLLISVYSHSFDAWTASLHRDTEQVVPVSGSRFYEHATVAGRLPDSGVRVRVECVRRITPPLSVVPVVAS